MATTVAELLIQRLLDWGVKTIFAFPGDGINGIFEAWRQNQDKLKYVQVRHEEAAALAACGHAKYTGGLGVCMATSGPGGIHLLNGLYDAKCDGQPVLAITGHTFHDLIGTHYQQDVDLTKLFMDVAAYNERIMGPAHVNNVVDEAIKTALSRRTVVHITIPKDIQNWSGNGERSNANIAGHSADVYAPSSSLPTQDELKERGTRTDKPMKPQVVTYQLNKLLRDDAIICCDTGTVTTWAARYLQMRGDMMFSASGMLATMGNGLPYATAAAVAYPGRQVIALCGDGGFTMMMGEMATLVKYKLPVKVIIIKNNTLGQIKWEQMVFEGNPQFGVDLQPIDFAKYAEACGAAGFTLEDPEKAEAVLREALDHPGPALVQAVVDANEPPMPGHATLEQAWHFAKALIRGEKHRADILKTVIENTIREVA